MAAETGIAIIVSVIPFFFLVYGYFMPKGHFTPLLQPLFYLAGLLFLTFTISTAYKFAAVESLFNIRDAMEAVLIWAERLIYLLVFLYSLGFAIDVVMYLKDTLRQKHG